MSTCTPRWAEGVRAIIFFPNFTRCPCASLPADARSEKVVQRALDNIMLGRTSVVIAHRLTTVRHAHNICVVHRGVLLEQVRCSHPPDCCPLATPLRTQRKGCRLLWGRVWVHPSATAHDVLPSPVACQLLSAPCLLLCTWESTLNPYQSDAVAGSHSVSRSLQGTHEALMELPNGAYARLVANQEHGSAPAKKKGDAKGLTKRVGAAPADKH